ncbi:MAG: prolyl oligopeptidase family serine peptidase [Acidobacteria bacterium]|nr:prolyl oligopeptidase family serine peptidase [Acidobacteriota bacterium]
MTSRKTLALLMLLLLPALVPAAQETVPQPEDPYRWLEEVEGEKALEWVREQNARTAAVLREDARFDGLYQQALTVLNSESRIPTVTIRGEWLYNFWKDDQHPRGIYRRTTLAELSKDQSKWQTVLDIDALSKSEGEKWVYKGMNCLEPEYVRCLVSLSPGGGDAVQIREFNLDSLEFVEDGFFLPVAKSNASWRDEDSLYVGTDFGPGSMTESGYPRISKLWLRGEPLAEAATIYEASPESVSASTYRIRTDDGDIDIVRDGVSFWTTRDYHLVDGELHLLNMPESAVIEGGYKGRIVFMLNEDWILGERTIPQGSVVLAAPSDLHDEAENVEVLVSPSKRQVVADVDPSNYGILVTMLDNVRGRLYSYRESEDGWSRTPVTFADHGAISVTTVDDRTGNFFVEYEGFTTPPTLFHVASDELRPRRIMSQEPTFDGSRFNVEQYWTTSTDGTKIPYFVVMPKSIELDGSNPTHIFSYGGFRNALTPSYSGSYEALFGAYGKMWLERGGVFVLANIRGGGEFGPAWHAAALRENRTKSFEDFEAVARDLVKRKITTHDRIGIEGRSNGGLLVTATMTREPELYGATIVGVPLADMKRYHKLLAGASWMAEFGNPDIPAEWEYISQYSPYHNLEEGVDYPPAFFFTSTRDDRVHPGHARKMVAKMLDLDQKVYYWENLEGGHGGSATNEQLAYRIALAYTHLWRELGDERTERRVTKKE